MTVILQDTFTRANQSGWGTASDGHSWSTGLTAGATATLAIASNEGTVGASGGGVYQLLGSGVVTTADGEGLVRFTWGTSNENVGIILRWTDSTHHYVAYTYNTTQVRIFKRNGSSSTTTIGTITNTGYTLAAGTYYWLKFRVQGTTLEWKLWPDGNSEPSSWTYSTTDSSLSSAGNGGLYVYSNSGSSVDKVDSFSVNDLSATTSTRQAPAAAALLATNTESAPASAALLALGVQRVAPQSAALQSLGILRAAPASADLAFTSTRAASSSAALLATVTMSAPSSAALLGTATCVAPASALVSSGIVRAAPASAALLATGLTRVAPSSAGLQSLGNIRVAPSSAALLDTSTQQAPASAALQSLGNVRSAPASAVLSGNAAAGTGIGDLAVTTKSQSWSGGPAGSPGTETDVTYTDALGAGWSVGLIPSYGGNPISSFYPVASNTLGTNQTGLGTSQPDGHMHWLEQSSAHGWQGSENGPYTLTELTPAGTVFRRYYQGVYTDAAGMQWTVTVCIYPGDPGYVAYRFDMHNPTGSAIGLVAGTAGNPSAYSFALIGGLQQSDSTWQQANGYSNTLGGTPALWTSSFLSGEPDYAYITPAGGGSASNLGVMTVKQTSLSGLGWSHVATEYLQASGASGRLKFAINGDQSSVASGATETLYAVSVFRRSLTATDAASIAADYLAPGTPSASAGTFTSFSYDERAYVFAAGASNHLNATLDMTGTGVTARFKPVFKITGWTSGSAPALTWGGVGLTAGVDYRFYNDTTNQILYLQLYFDVVASGAGSGQKNNAALDVSVPAPRLAPASAALQAVGVTRLAPATAALVATSTRLAPASSALLATLTRVAPASSALLATGLTRAAPSGAALLASGLTRVAAASVLVTTGLRLAPMAAALQATNTRVAPQSAALLGTSTRQAPSGASLAFTNTRQAPGSAGMLATLTRVTPASVALAASGVVRAAPAAALVSTPVVASPTAVTVLATQPSATTIITIQPTGTTVKL